MKYNLENYLEYNKELEIYDLLASNKFIDKLRNLSYKKAVTINNRDLDEVSLEIYETEDLWWVIAIYNNVINPLDVSLSILYTPSKSDLEKLFLEFQEK